MSRSAWPIVLLGLLASCRPAPAAPPVTPAGSSSAELELRMTALEGRLAMLERLMPSQGAGADTGDALPADSVARVGRVEARLDKVVGFLRQAVRPELDTSQMYAIPVEANDPVVGAADAPVTMIEAFEFLCPYCNLLEPTIERLQRDFPKTLRVVTKYMVIHGPPAVPSGLAACAAGRQGKYAPFKAAVWGAIWPSEDGSADRSEAEPEALERRASKLGLDLKRYRADVADGGPCEAWMASTAQILETFGVSGTPTVIVNGRVIDSRDYDTLKAAIDAEVKKVRASGVADGRYYREVVMARGQRAAVMVSPFE